MRLYGKNSVIERLRSNPKSIKKIYLQQELQEISYVRRKAREWGIPLYIVPRSKILKLGQNINTQGVIIETEEFSYVLYDQLLENALKKQRSILYFDGLNDPQNLGALMRSAACLGKFSIVLPTHDSVSITSSVLRVASGADNYIPIAMVSNLNHSIDVAREAGFTIAGAVVKGGQCLFDTKFTFPLGLVVGSEQKGIKEVIRKNLDLEVTIPMGLDTLSFNVAHATAILCYEISRQKKGY